MNSSSDFVFIGAGNQRRGDAVGRWPLRPCWCKCGIRQLRRGDSSARGDRAKEGVGWPRSNRHRRISTAHVRHHSEDPPDHRSCCEPSSGIGSGCQTLPAPPSIFCFAGISDDLDWTRHRRRRVSVRNWCRAQRRGLPGECGSHERHHSQPGRDSRCAPSCEPAAGSTTTVANRLWRYHRPGMPAHKAFRDVWRA